MDIKGLQELRNRAALLDEFITENQALKEENARLKRLYRDEKENNIYRREHEQKSREEKEALLEHRELTEGIKRDKPMGYWEAMAAKGIIKGNAPAVIAERNWKR